MKCQHCGNELVPDEVFCGQCGNPNSTPVQPTEMMQAPSSINGLMGSVNRADMFPASQAGPSQSAIRPNQGPHQQGGFYQDATEAVSLAPGTQYPQQGYQHVPGMSTGYNNSGQFGTQTQQPFPTGNYPPNMTYAPTTMGFSSGQFGQGYGSRVNAPEKRNNALLVVGIVCLVFAIITVGAVGTLFALKGTNNTQSTPTVVVQATATPTPSPTPSPLPSPTPTPSPTAVPTPTPDANFSWCDTQCTQSGYQIEFPNSWSQGATQNGNGPGIQFTDTVAASTDTIYAAVKTPSTSATSASDLLTADEANFSGQAGYQGKQSLPSVTIGGENWNAEVLYYQLNNQTEQVNLYATIHQGKGYVIELQAAQTQFSSINSQYFGLMLTSFQFVAPTA